jgi:hypothetical protein
MQKRFRMAFRFFELSLNRHHQSRFLDIQKTDYDLYWPFVYLKHHLSEFVKVAFFDAQDAEIVFTYPLD